MSEKPKPDPNELLREIVARSTPTATAGQPAKRDDKGRYTGSDAAAGTGRKDPLPPKRDPNELLRTLTFHKTY